MDHVAVYGTLRKGEGLHPALGGSRFVGECRINGFKMWGDFDSFPYAVEQTGPDAADHFITVEVYGVMPEVLATLDGIEGYPNHYDRKKVTACNRSAWIYFTKGRPHWSDSEDGWITSGDWKKRTGSPLIY